jgi:hypothetical protein
MKTSGKAIIAIVVVGVIAFVAYGGEFPSSGTGGTTVIGSVADTPVMTAVNGQSYNGDLLTTTNNIDSNDPATTYDGASDYSIICYERVGSDVRDWEVLDTGAIATGTEMSIPIRKTTSTDDGITEMWCEVSPSIGGQALYIDKDAVIQANSRIDTAVYEDPNLDQTPTWVFRVNLLDISPADPNQTPTLQLRLKSMEEAVSADLDPSTTSVSNAGTGNHENRIKNNIDFVTTSSGNDSGAKALSQIVIRLNTTDDTIFDANSSYIEVPNGASVQRIKLSQMDENELTSTTTFKFKYGNDVANANLIVVEKSADPEIATPLILFTNFSTTDQAICTQTEFKYVDSFNSFSTTSVDVEVAEGAIGDECVF